MTRGKKGILGALGVGLAATAIGGVTIITSASAKGSATPLVGLITKTNTNPFFVKMKEGAAAAAKKNGLKLVSAAGKTDGDNAGQVAAIESMVSQGVKGILITPSDTKAIVPAIKKARAAGVLVIALDTPPEPASSVDALYATDNFQAGQLIGQYAKAVFGSKTAKIATLDLVPARPTVDVLRHNGFLSGFGVKGITSKQTKFAKSSLVVCSADSEGNTAKGQSAMETCLQKAPDINLLYTINEPAAVGAYTALKAAGKEKQVTIVSVDGGCAGVRAVKAGQITATSQQYPLLMASEGVAAVAKFAKTGVKPHGYINTGVNLITPKPAKGVKSQGLAFGLAKCWG